MGNDRVQVGKYHIFMILILMFKLFELKMVTFVTIRKESLCKKCTTFILIFQIIEGILVPRCFNTWKILFLPIINCYVRIQYETIIILQFAFSQNLWGAFLNGWESLVLAILIIIKFDFWNNLFSNKWSIKSCDGKVCINNCFLWLAFQDFNKIS